MRIGVLALQGDVREHLLALQTCGAEAVAVRRPAELDAVDGLVIPGGESTTISKLAVIFELMAPLRQRLREGLPAFGSCAGMILLADRILDAPADQESIGGIDMTVRRNAFGRQVDSFEESVVVEGMVGPPLSAVFIRAPWVEQMGPQARPLARIVTAPARMDTASARMVTAPARMDTAPARSATATAGIVTAPARSATAGSLTAPVGAADGRPPAGRVVAVRQGRLLATSFHPELTDDRRLHEYFCNMVKETIR